jgi:hypothetical protein
MERRGIHVEHRWESQEEGHQEDKDIGGRIIYEWILERLYGVV